MVSSFTAIPIYFWTLLWHPDGQSVLDMLLNPKGNGCLIQLDNDRNRHCWRERLQPVPQWARHTRLRRIKTHLPNNPEILPLRGYDSRLCMFSYYQIHIQQALTRLLEVHHLKMASLLKSLKWHIRTGFYLSFGAKLLHKARPKTPHCRLISLALVLISTLDILGILSIMACHWIYVHNGFSKGGKSTSSLQGIPGISEGDASIIGTSEGDTLGISEGANAFGCTSSFANVDTEQLNTQVHFDTDSSFFVCDNSTTGHIAMTFGNLTQVAFDKQTKA